VRESTLDRPFICPILSDPGKPDGAHNGYRELTLYSLDAEFGEVYFLQDRG
jgi:hypothetical protein